MWVALLVFALIIIAFLWACKKDSDKSGYTYYDASNDYYEDSSDDSDYEYHYISQHPQKPKIGAEISPDLYNEISSYCFRNSISISELIRRSVSEYIKNK